MENDQNADKLSEARSSRDQQPNSNASKIFKSFCSCFMPCLFKVEKQDITQSSETPYQKGPIDGSQYGDSKVQQSLISHQSTRIAWETKKQSLIRSVYEHANRLLQDYDESLDKSTIKKWHSYSIYEYRENELVAMGTSKGRILCKIVCARVQPSASVKKKTSQARPIQKPADRYIYTNFDNYWNKRYLLFQKFDQGISLDDQSWYSVTPQAVAEHIAGKIKCDTVLDGFCGAGGMAIKLANTCSRVICNDVERVRLKLLERNAKVYCVENIQMLNQDFLKIEGVQPDIVFLDPPFGPQQRLISNLIQPNQLNPPLSKIFRKATSLSKNIVLLLPPNINVHRLGELIAKQYMDSKIVSSTCSIKIQKIFFMSHLRYLVVYLGSMIETQISLNDELCYIYNYLKEGDKKTFKHKKLVKYLREKYGMIDLLNFVFQLDQVHKTGTLIEKFYEFIKQKNLIDQARLAKIIKQQNQEEEAYKRKKIPLIQEQQIMEEEKYTGEEADKEATLSYYSENSANKVARDDSKLQQSGEIRKSVRSAYSSVLDNKQIQLQQIPRSNTTVNDSNKKEVHSQRERSTDKSSKSQEKSNDK